MQSVALDLQSRFDVSPTGKDTDRLCFDGFVLTPGERLLTRDDHPIEIGGRSLDLLLALIQQPGRVVPKLELLQRVWRGAVVEDGALRFHVASLRKALGDDGAASRLIKTQVGVGYAFVGSLRRGDPVMPVALPPFVTPAPRTSGAGLPGRQDQLIGRGQDLKAVLGRISTGKILTIVGAAGVGKTSLAIEAAHVLAPSFTGGANFIDLAAARTPEAALAKINEVSESALIQDQRRLIVLDNCEHLVAAVADLAERISVSAPAVALLVTSRQALRARNEHVHRLAPHAFPTDIASCSREALLGHSAVELFLRSAAAAGRALDEDVETLRSVALICRRLDGVALSIEIAAMRAATHGVDATSRRLGDGLSLLWQGRRTAQPRHRTLRATLDWSYDLLSDTGRSVFERLSLLPGPFSLEAALEYLIHDALDVVSAASALDELAEHALITAIDEAYHLPEMTRRHAWERLQARSLAEAASPPDRPTREVFRVLDVRRA